MAQAAQAYAQAKAQLPVQMEVCDLSGPTQPIAKSDLIQQLLDQLQREKADAEPARRGVKRTSTENVTMSVREWFDCLQQFILLVNPKFQPDEHHLCSSECEMFVYKPQLYVCKSTGRVHMCAPQQCNRLERTREHIVCQVTAMVYPSDIPLTMKGDHECYKDELDLQREALRKKHKPNQKTVGQEQRDQKIKTELEQLRLTKPEQKLTREESKAYRQSLPYHRKETLFDIEKLQTEALNIINKLFGAKLDKVKQRVDLELLARCVVDWWVTAQQQLRKDSSERSDYSFKYHCLACMYVIKGGGFSIGDRELIPSLATVAENIIQQKNLKLLFSQPGVKSQSINSRRVTKAIKILKQHLV